VDVVKEILVPVSQLEVTLTVNGATVRRNVPARRLLVDFLREDLGLTGTHSGCEHGICGACTVLIDGVAARSCITFAVQHEGADITTVEGLTPDDGLSPMQEAFKACHGLQCGFCTPGFLTTLAAAEADEHPDDAAIRDLLSGNLCRCTGYEHIVQAVRRAWGRDEDSQLRS
jgi:carbon-monoxide dehydrogenase small subunit